MLAKNIVLLHGWGASVKKLKPLAKNLQKLGWHVFLPKLPGFEKKSPSEAWSLENYSEYLLSEATKKFEGKRFFVFGHSFGGRIAIKISLMEKKKVTGIVLCASGGLSRGSLTKRFIFFVLAKIGKIFLVYPNLAKKFKKLIYKIAREHDYEKSKGIMKDTFRKVLSENLRLKVKDIYEPTLILWGQRDKMTPYQDALFLEKNVPDSLLVSFSNQGHKLPYQRPERIAKEVDKWFQSMN